ncbi:zinc finger protein CONSTANS-LIKE 1-like [Andrographis paniculata]|uniref:zinc finger protein CONSTANS-LIKE 1-like n=1 Tax=Andrographis paniculata TaxID=175694 RepID=UPI0021E74252|nr:zinc finger protein CONSTANS-LIKE 1-like [Andrographis paniculata]
MKKCELCKKAARIYCDSDKASLCWDCDSRVHSANSIVTKHTRVLLCRACRTPTPWTGSGPRLAPTVALCVACVRNGYDKDEDEDEEIKDFSIRNDNDDDDGENQVVPWALQASSMASTTDDSCRVSSRVSGMSEKRQIRDRENQG